MQGTSRILVFVLLLHWQVVANYVIILLRMKATDWWSHVMMKGGLRLPQLRLMLVLLRHAFTGRDVAS